MEYIQTVPRTDLARKTRRVLNAVQRGQTAIIESHGQPEAALIDIVDYRILRAATRYYNNPPAIDPEARLPDEAVDALEDTQERFNLVMAYYLAQSISLGRVAELLEIPWVSLRMCLSRLDVPVFVGPETMEEIQAEVDAIVGWKTREG
ncbi:MAG: type II toxin-antitoxin system prevent-host-death family antitoxin [Chloroflexi bacterium]|nr:type II toxin-antitoxin system prevent-host-death family antitoxin [Chloroflexota bacterium]